ncbi:hypothetical protein KJY77_03925 [Canibacter sp. lx-72]|uniref:hypothetical protein n=1 Tax=Canibacter zhuwentaonis TaxID=2837491 RepID=UPI001BDBCA2C|nr:hypothetical protein [Canibacter zhuwentaonis]MBT1018286.1 hypothetical protein [Canibacter zhuwentaonis]
MSDSNSTQNSHPRGESSRNTPQNRSLLGGGNASTPSVSNSGGEASNTGGNLGASNPGGTGEQSNKNTPNTPVMVRVQRAVHIKRLLLIGVVMGAMCGAGVALLFDVKPEGFYTLGQIVGFTAVLGGAVGLLLAAMLALLLSLAVKRKNGTATAVQASVK